MEKIFYKDKDFGFNLSYGVGTGFEWLIVYTSDNVEIVNEEYKSNNREPASTGGRGNYHLECKLNDDEDGMVILRYSRRWEYYGDYATFIIHSHDGHITEITESDRGNNNDMNFIYNDTDNGSFTTFMFNDWEYEEYEEEGRIGFKVKPADRDRYALIYQTSESEDFVPEKTFTIWESEYKTSGRRIYGPEGLIYDAMDTEWFEEYCPDIIKLLDSAVSCEK